jgi:tocopherol cyclase
MCFYSLLNPEVFQGSIHKRNYFEGWYFKLVTRDQGTALSVIPGISTARGDAHSFIQVLQPYPGRTAYVRYPIQRFAASKRLFYVNIEENFFTAGGMVLNVRNPELNLKGTLDFTDITPFPKGLFRRGIMGPFGFIPFMECYHGIVNIRHKITGSLTIDGKEVDFSEGAGYIEKDWGRSFPTAWIWFQSHFAESDATVMFSLADIPFLGRRFCGILSFLCIGGRYYAIATYNGARVRSFSLGERSFSIHLQNKKYELFIKADHSESGLLKAPVKGMMQRDIRETLKARSYVEFKTAEGGMVFQGQNSRTGLEICGDVQSLLQKVKWF